MNLLQLAQRLHRESGRSGAGPTTGDDATKDHRRLFDWISDANVELESRPIDWRWMRRRSTGACTADTLSYSPAALGISDFGRWRPHSDAYSVKAFSASDPTNVWRLGWLSLEQFRETYVDGDPPASRPMDWSIDDDGSLLIGPKQDEDYSLRLEYLRTPLVLSEDDDTPEMDTQFHMTLVWRALIEVGKFDNAPDVLSRASSNFGRDENNLLHEYARPITFGGPLA